MEERCTTRKRALSAAWRVYLIVMGVLLIAVVVIRGASLSSLSGPWRFAVLAGLAFGAEYIDSSLGMGYGTALAPLLLLLGFTPIQIVPAVLLSEFVTGVSAGIAHHSLGNVDLGRGSKARKVVWILSGCSVVGGVAAVFLALKLPTNIVKLYIGAMVLAVGLFILFGRRLVGGFSWRNIVGLGTLAAFNKGISGGGYGPLLTGGQILAGVSEKEAVGVTSLAEGVVCLVGVILYVALHGMPEWSLALPLLTGAILSVPAATWTVKLLPAKSLRRAIGFLTILLGILTLAKAL